MNKLIKNILLSVIGLCVILMSIFTLSSKNGSNGSDGNISDNNPKISQNAGFVSKNGFLSVKETALVNEHQQEIVLRGVSFGWHLFWPRFYNEKTVTWLKEDWKVNVVRAAIGLDLPGNYIENPQAAFDCLFAVVDAAIKNDIYVIIDWHTHNIHLNAAIDFFKQVATKYKDYPNIIYEIFNEPDYQSWSEVKDYSIEVIKTIRSIDKRNIILVGSPHWSQDIHFAADDPITGYDNLMYTLHFYAATHGDFLRQRVDYALEKGLPLFVSECAAMEATGDGPINIQSWQKWLDVLNRNNISWITWSVSDKDETCSMIVDETCPAYGWKDEHLKEWGKIVRNSLRE